MTVGEKVDLFRTEKDQYVARKKPVLVDVRRARYLAIEGRGAPEGAEFSARIGALYGVAYTVKMTRKFGGEQDYVVSKLEAQWWCDDGKMDLSVADREGWQWRLLIRTPDFVKKAEIGRALRALNEKGKGELADEVSLEWISEGRCVQLLHVGPYEKEGESFELMGEFARSEGLVPHGRTHDIYVSDPRRVPPERLKTILRMPVKKG